MLKYICDGIQYHHIINRREARYNICDTIKQRQVYWKGALLSTRNMGKCLHKLFKAVVNKLSEYLPIFGESGSEVSYFIPGPINIAEVTRLSEDISKPWLKATLKYNKNLIDNYILLVDETKKRRAFNSMYGCR